MWNRSGPPSQVPTSAKFHRSSPPAAQLRRRASRPGEWWPRCDHHSTHFRRGGLAIADGNGIPGVYAGNEHAVIEELRDSDAGARLTRVRRCGVHDSHRAPDESRRPRADRERVSETSCIPSVQAFRRLRLARPDRRSVGAGVARLEGSTSQTSPSRSARSVTRLVQLRAGSGRLDESRMSRRGALGTSSTM